MPAQPAYFHRLADAILTLEALSELDWIDRRTLQEILGVSKTVAWRILRRCGATEGPGNTLVCRRADLVAALKGLEATGAYQQEIRRRERLETQLGDLLKIVQSRRVRVASFPGGRVEEFQVCEVACRRRPLPFPPPDRVWVHGGFSAKNWFHSLRPPERFGGCSGVFRNDSGGR